MNLPYSDFKLNQQDLNQNGSDLAQIWPGYLFIYLAIVAVLAEL